MASAMHLHKMLVRNSKLLKAAWRSLQENISQRISTSKPISIRIPVASRQPLHPIAALKQRQSGWTRNSGARYFGTSTARAGKPSDKSTWPTSMTRTCVEQLTSRAPFASTLRPNLTGGAFPRSAGGYSLGSGRTGGARYFSHSPAAPAQVVQNVSQGIRAFLLSGHRAQYSGVDPITGEKRYKAVSPTQAEVTKLATCLPVATPGSFIDFRVNPTITALTPVGSIAGFAGLATEDSEDAITMNTLNTSGLLDALSVDFSRALKGLAAILTDLRSLAQLGDLPITYRVEDGASKIRVHFPGCDAQSVENLCSEIGIKRGIVFQDDNFDAYVGTDIALLFPFAPSDSEYSAESLPDDKHVYEQYFAYLHDRPASSKERASADLWLSDPSPRLSADEDSLSWSHQTGYEFLDNQPVLSSSSSGRSFALAQDSPTGLVSRQSPQNERPSIAGSNHMDNNSPLEYQDFEGIYRFIELCDQVR